MQHHTANVLLPFIHFVMDWEANRHPNLDEFLEVIEHPKEREWFCDMIDVYLQHSPFRPEPSPEALAFVQKLMRENPVT